MCGLDRGGFRSCEALGVLRALIGRGAPLGTLFFVFPWSQVNIVMN